MVIAEGDIIEDVVKVILILSAQDVVFNPLTVGFLINSEVKCL